MNMLKTLKHIFNAWPQSWVSDQHVLHKVKKVNIVVDLVELFLGEQGLAGSYDSEVELKIVRRIEQKLPGQKFI